MKTHKKKSTRITTACCTSDINNDQYQNDDGDENDSDTVDDDYDDDDDADNNDNTVADAALTVLATITPHLSLGSITITTSRLTQTYPSFNERACYHAFTNSCQ